MARLFLASKCSIRFLDSVLVRNFRISYNINICGKIGRSLTASAGVRSDPEIPLKISGIPSKFSRCSQLLNVIEFAKIKLSCTKVTYF